MGDNRTLQRDTTNFSFALGADEALVLLELLSRWSNDGQPLQVNDSSEKVALDGLLCLLEKQLVDPLKSDYVKRLEEARTALRLRGGTP